MIQQAPPVDSESPNAYRRTPAFMIALAWLFVGVPAIWGVSQTISTSLKLFHPPAATTSATPPAGSGTAAH